MTTISTRCGGIRGDAASPLDEAASSRADEASGLVVAFNDDVLFGPSSSGGAVIYEFEPGFYSAFSQLLPPGAALVTPAAVERGEPGINTVCGDGPAPAAVWVPALTEARGAGPQSLSLAARLLGLPTLADLAQEGTERRAA